MEREINNSVPFLDTLLIRLNDNRVILNWYQKPTSSGRYINYHSNHPMGQKRNTIIAMKNRVTHISDDRFLKENLEKLMQLFLNNGYPRKLLQTLIFRTAFYDGPTEDQVPQSTKYKKIPYIQGLTNNIMKYLKSNNRQLPNTIRLL